MTIGLRAGLSHDHSRVCPISDNLCWLSFRKAFSHGSGIEDRMPAKGSFASILRPSIVISLVMFVIEWMVITYLGNPSLVDGIALYNIPVAIGLFFFGRWLKEIGTSKRLVRLIFILTVVWVAFTERDLVIIISTSILLTFMASGYFMTK